MRSERWRFIRYADGSYATGLKIYRPNTPETQVRDREIIGRAVARIRAETPGCARVLQTLLQVVGPIQTPVPLALAIEHGPQVVTKSLAQCIGRRQMAGHLA